MKQLANEQLASPEEAADDDRAVVSRRRLLKAITAAGGAAAVFQFAPHQWTRPIVEIGSLPAHAQTSLIITLFNGKKEFIDINDCQAGSRVGSTNKVSFAYNDPAGRITAGAVLLFSSRFPNIELEEFDIFDIPEIEVEGGPFQGTISFKVCTFFGSANEAVTWLRLRNAQGDLSPPLLITAARPPGAAGTGGAGLERLQ